MSEITARRARTRDRLMDAALGVFAEKGVLAASVEEICEAAGFTRGAFYSNFSDKEELCGSIIDRMGEQALESARLAIGWVTTQREIADVDTVIRQAVDVFRRSSPMDATMAMAHAELELFAARTPSVRRHYTELQAAVTAAVIPMMDETVEALGWEWATPMADLISILSSVRIHSLMNGILAGDDPSQVLGDDLTTIVRLAVRPRSGESRCGSAPATSAQSGPDRGAAG